jgi:hypothetical protein
MLRAIIKPPICVLKFRCGCPFDLPAGNFLSRSEIHDVCPWCALVLLGLDIITINSALISRVSLFQFRSLVQAESAE